MADEDWDERCEATLTKRLLRRLRNKNILSDEDLLILAYPSEEALQEAEAGEVL